MKRVMISLMVVAMLFVTGCGKSSHIAEDTPDTLETGQINAHIDKNGRCVGENGQPLSVYCMQMSEIYKDAMIVYTDGKNFFFDMEGGRKPGTTFQLLTIERYASDMTQSVSEVKKRLSDDDFYATSKKVNRKENYDIFWNDYTLPSEISPKSEGEDLLYEKDSLDGKSIYLDSHAFPIKLCIVADKNAYALANTGEWYTFSAITEDIKIEMMEKDERFQSITFSLEQTASRSSYMGFMDKNNYLYLVAYNGKELDPGCLWMSKNFTPLTNTEVKAFICANDLSNMY